MKLDLDFRDLENLVKRMGASTVEWVSDVAVTHVEADWKITLETKGLEVDIKDVDIHANGLLKFRGEQILLYIKEISSISQYGLPKFHFYDCATLRTMKSRGRFERYVVTQRKTGYFLMDKKIGQDFYERNVEERLDVCKNCLNWYNRNYRKRYTVATFDIVAFFEQFVSSPINQKPTGTDLLPAGLTSVTSFTKATATDLRRENNASQAYALQTGSNLLTNTEFTVNDQPVAESYAEIQPILFESRPVELELDEKSKKFEDMF